MKRFSKFKRIAMMSAVLFFIMVINAYATTPTQPPPQFVTSIRDLARDVTFWLASLLAPVTTGAMLGYFAWQKSIASGEGEATEVYNRKMKRTLIGGVLTICASGIASFILGYF